MNLNFSTRRTNPITDYFLSLTINYNESNTMKLGNYDSDYDDDDDDSSYDPDEDLDMMFDDEDLDEINEIY